MLTNDDMLWFLMTWSFFTNELPQIFLVIGTFALIIGCCLGAFLIGNVTTGIIVSVVGFVIALIVLIGWLTMLAYNKKREADSMQRIKTLLLQEKEVCLLATFILND